MRIGIYPGSFDPLTYGHLDIIKRSIDLCDKLFIAIARNSAKKTLFSVDERMEMVEKSCGEFGNRVETRSFEGLVADFCVRNNVSIIFRGLRSSLDYEYERPIGVINKKLAPDTETVFLLSRDEYSFISSNIVKEIASHSGDISGLVPHFVLNSIEKKYSLQNR